MITLEIAKKLTRSGEEKAKEIGQPMNIAVVDAGANLVSHVRMDEAWIGSVDIAIDKAYTAKAFDMATQDLAELAKPGGVAFGIHVSNNGRVMVFAGGVPVKENGKIIGAVGVSGGTPEQDHAVAEAAVRAYE